ncbi:TPA: helix-turn-helix transcriptional regulator [bacterium]|jgi:transcriptional regulator with XRE-family HTH domain|nr:helix-turn-helix transcriptional regulator [bacterium]
MNYEELVLKKFGERVRKLRQMLNISQEELAFRCSLHPNYISDIERGRRNLSLISIAKLASGLDVGIDALFIE